MDSGACRPTSCQVALHACCSGMRKRLVRGRQGPAAAGPPLSRPLPLQPQTLPQGPLRCPARSACRASSLALTRTSRGVMFPVLGLLCSQMNMPFLPCRSAVVTTVACAHRHGQPCSALRSASEGATLKAIPIPKLPKPIEPGASSGQLRRPRLSHAAFKRVLLLFYSRKWKKPRKRNKSYQSCSADDSR